MNDQFIKSAANKQIVTRNISSYESDLELNVTYDLGMANEYARQLGGKKTWMTKIGRVFSTDMDMIKFAEYFDRNGNLSKCRPATQAQVSYMNVLGIEIEDGLTVERASALIDAAKSGNLGSVYGFRTDGSN